MKRTTPQNNALHLALDELAQEMYMRDMDMRTTIKIPIRPTKDNVKELMFKPVMTALYPDIKSTTQLSTKQMDECWRWFSERVEESMSIYIPWPSLEEQRKESQ